MRRRDSLRFRILASFTIVGLVLGSVFGMVVAEYLHGLEDELIANQLTLLSNDYTRMLNDDPTVAPPDDVLVTGFLGEEGLPEELRERVSRLAPGIHELDDLFHLHITALADGRRFYLFHDDRGVESLEGSWLIQLIVTGTVLVTLLAAWLGHMMGNRIMAPLSVLARQVRDLDPKDLPRKLEGDFYEDEVGLLAEALERSLARTAELLEREKRFTRDASHEMRTPVTVIKGAAELIARASDAGRPVTVPLRRLDRAVKDIENIIETFLYLGREGHQSVESESLDLAEVVADAIKANRYLIEDKAVTVHQESGPDTGLTAPRRVVAIAIGNLIRNAFQYTETGSVRVTVASDRVAVIDTGRGMDAETRRRVTDRDRRAGPGEGFGLGLAIVGDFCARFGWRLAIESEKEKGTRAILLFSDNEEKKRHESA